MAKTIKVTVTAKIGGLKKTSTFDYSEPADFEEAIEMDGEDKAFKTYLNERKTNFQDQKRREMIKQITEKIGALDKDQLAELGLDL